MSPASYREATVAETNAAASFNESEWSIAQPGKPANLPPDAADPTGHGGWRTATEPIPVVVAEGLAAGASPDAKTPPIEPLQQQSDAAPPPVIHKKLATRPLWTADRSGTAPSPPTTTPTWSSKR